MRAARALVLAPVGGLALLAAVARAHARGAPFELELGAGARLARGALVAAARAVVTLDGGAVNRLRLGDRRLA